MKRMIYGFLLFCAVILPTAAAGQRAPVAAVAGTGK